MKLKKTHFKFIAVILAGVFVWSVYRFLYDLSTLLLEYVGITDPLWANGMLIIIFGAILTIYGTPIIKLFK